MSEILVTGAAVIGFIACGIIGVLGISVVLQVIWLTLYASRKRRELTAAQKRTEDHGQSDTDVQSP